MNTASMDVAINPLWVVEQILNKIMSVGRRSGKHRDTIPIKGFTQAPARLKRLGISHLVTLEDGRTGKEELVPLWVEDDSSVIHTRFCKTDDLTSWRGKEIHRITKSCFRNAALLDRRVRQCLKTAWNRFRHKIEKSLHKLNIRVGRCRPWRARKDRLFRYEAARMCH